jgi:hypothetical protein
VHWQVATQYAPVLPIDVRFTMFTLTAFGLDRAVAFFQIQHDKSPVRVRTGIDVNQTLVEIPVIFVETPFIFIETPFIFVETPFIFVETPFIFVETPFIFVETPFILIETPFILIETPFIFVRILLLSLDNRLVYFSTFCLDGILQDAARYPGRHE